MRERGRELLRRHEMDSYLAKHPLSSANELIDHLDRKHLLNPAEDQVAGPGLEQ